MSEMGKKEEPQEYELAMTLELRTRPVGNLTGNW